MKRLRFLLLLAAFCALVTTTTPAQAGSATITKRGDAYWLWNKSGTCKGYYNSTYHWDRMTCGSWGTAYLEYRFTLPRGWRNLNMVETYSGDLHCRLDQTDA